MPKLVLEYVSDFACPWCAIGWHSLKQALDRVGSSIDAAVVFRPFELNPAAPREGVNIYSYIASRSGMGTEQIAEVWRGIMGRAQAIGYPMDIDAQSRFYNSFDAHRLVAWAAEQGKARAIYEALLDAHFITQRDYGSHAVLSQIAGEVGLDAAAVGVMLASDAYRDQTEREMIAIRSKGVQAVPTLIPADGAPKSGSASPEEYETALRQWSGKALMS